MKSFCLDWFIGNHLIRHQYFVMQLHKQMAFLIPKGFLALNFQSWFINFSFFFCLIILIQNISPGIYHELLTCYIIVIFSILSKFHTCQKYFCQQLKVFSKPSYVQKNWTFDACRCFCFFNLKGFLYFWLIVNNEWVTDIKRR